MISSRLTLLPRPGVIVLLALGLSLMASAAVIAAELPPDAISRPAQDSPTPQPEPNGAAIIDFFLNIDPYTAWESWPSNDLNPDDFSGYLPSEAPHGIVVRIFANTVALAALDDPGFAGELPPGSIIVKENYAPTHDEPATLVALTVMVKFADFYPKGGDWFWVKAAPDGSLINAEGAVKGCIDCHEASESDYLLRYQFGGAAGSSGMDIDALIDTRCTACHTRERIDLASKDADGWIATVDRMIGYGAQLSAGERDALIAALSGTGADTSVLPETLDAELLINTRCVACHTRDRIDLASKDAAGWIATVDRMIGYGAPLSTAERDLLIDYLTQRGVTIIINPSAPESIIDLRCTVCHSRDRIDVANKDAAGWAATVDRMIGYGAPLNAAERDTLISYLAGRGAAITVDPNNPEMIINIRCTVCHTRARIDEEDDDLEGWTETVDRMVSYGASLTAQERQTLLNYLVATHGKDSGKDDKKRDDDKDDD